MSHSDRELRLLDMLELDATRLIGVVTEVRRLATVLEQDLAGADSSLDVGDVRNRISETIRQMTEQLSLIGAQSAWVAANRLHAALADPGQIIRFHDLKVKVQDIESRFADHLSFVRLFVIHGEQLGLLGTPTELLGEPTASRFTSIWFDCEEAAKCICVQRPTAAVFHAMRMLEIGIRAFSARLGIPDPVKSADRNWGVILKSIKAKIDQEFPAAKRGPNSEGVFLEGLYATLDAVKNPWRNATMHVEGIYTDTQARFILICTINFIQTMASSFDEKGEPVEDGSLPI